MFSFSTRFSRFSNFDCAFLSDPCFSTARSYSGPENVVPKISQETLAEMIGTTRSRVSFFMNRFRKLGFIHYNGGLQVHSSLLNVVLHD
jgi:CRP-like cAMP-binding protein